MLTRSLALSLALSALLAISSCLPCYTLAYADEGSAYVLEEENSEVLRSDGGGASAAPGELEFASDAADEGAAGGGVGPESEGLGEAEASPAADGGLADDASLYQEGISPYAVQFSVIDTLMGSAWSGEGTQFVIGSNKISAKNGTIIWAVLAAADVLEYISDQLKAVDADMVGALNYIQSQLRSISTNNQSYVNSIVGLSQNQWGYWIGDTLIVKKNSPAEKLSALLDITNYLSAQLKTVGGTVSYISDQVKSVASLMPQGSTVVYISDQIKAVGGYVSANGSKVDAVFDSVDYISDQLKSIASLMPLGSDVSYMREQLKSIGGYIVSNGGLFEDIYLALESDTGISRLLAEWADRWDTQDRVLMEWGTRWDVQDRVLMEWGARWDVQDRMMVEWGKAWEAYRDSVLSALGDGLSLDVSGIESRLDDIRGLLLAAGAVENAKDLLDLLIGDLSGIGQAAATGAIQGAMESAFPFCVPAVVKQVFGLLAYEGSAPVWDFDICGHPLVCDFSGFQLVADCTSWLSRVGLVLALLVNTRKFVFALNGGGSS